MSATCWRWPATTRSSPLVIPTAPTPCSGGSRREPGSACPPATAPRATACTTGRSSAWTTVTPILVARLASTGCWCAATALPASWPSTVAGHPVPCSWPPWSGLPAAAGPSRSASGPPRAWSAWTPIRCAAGAPGIAGPPWPMVAHAVLVVLAATHRTRHPPPAGLISLTCNEVQHLFAALLARPVGDLGHRLRWSLWRRRQQARARTCHHRRQAARQP